MDINDLPDEIKRKAHIGAHRSIQVFFTLITASWAFYAGVYGGTLSKVLCGLFAILFVLPMIKEAEKEIKKADDMFPGPVKVAHIKIARESRPELEAELAKLPNETIYITKDGITYTIRRGSEQTDFTRTTAP